MGVNSPFTLRSGSTKTAGQGALFASARTVSSGFFENGTLEPGALPRRSAADAEVRPGDVLVTLRGPVNAAAVLREELPQPVFATLDLAVLRTSSELDPGYLTWFINLPATQTALASLRVSSGIPRLPLAALGSLVVPLSSLGAQRRIAAISDLCREEARITSALIRARHTLLQHTLSTIAQRSAQGAAPCTP